MKQGFGFVAAALASAVMVSAQAPGFLGPLEITRRSLPPLFISPCGPLNNIRSLCKHGQVFDTSEKVSTASFKTILATRKKKTQATGGASASVLVIGLYLVHVVTPG